MRAEDRYIDIRETEPSIVPMMIGLAAVGTGGGMLLGLIWYMGEVLVHTL